DSRASRLAHVLIGRGVRPGDAIAVLLERSPELVVTVLALMKAGAVYVPLDVRYPAERIRHVLTDTGARLLLTDDRAVTELQLAEVRLAGVTALAPTAADPGGPGGPDDLGDLAGSGGPGDLGDPKV
ncbi:AMP-binding protein, partial [Streptomyces actinomycinicus]